MPLHPLLPPNTYLSASASNCPSISSCVLLALCFPIGFSAFSCLYLGLLCTKQQTHEGTCEGASDPYTCLLEHRSERWFPQVYREHCIFTRPSLQQPDFERSSCSENCLRRGMFAWLSLLHRGDLSWDSFLEKIPRSCTFKSTGLESDLGSLRAQTRLSDSLALAALGKARLERYYIIHRRLINEEASSGHHEESTIVPGEYWEGLEAGEKRGWVVTNTFYAPADEQEVLPLVQRLTGRSTGEAICLFREPHEHEHQDGLKARFGMLPGRSCTGSIGVLYVLALESHPPSGVLGASLGFDLCVSHRVLREEVVAEDTAVEELRLRTRVTIGTPCGVVQGLEKGLWDAGFYAARYPQARGVEGLPTGGECPWKGALQLGTKCFLTTNQSGQSPLVVNGVGAAGRRKEEGCPDAALTSPDKLGNRFSAIVAACPAARTWPPWKPISNAHSRPARRGPPVCGRGVATPPSRLSAPSGSGQKDHPFPLGFLGVMRFCGAGKILAGPWPLQPQINIRHDSRLKDLKDGVYEVCYCSPVQVGDSAVSCVEGDEFRFLRALLQLSSGDARTRRVSLSKKARLPVTDIVGPPYMPLKPLPGAAAAPTAPGAASSLGVWLEALPSEIGTEFVFCKVGADRRIDGSCRFILHSSGATEKTVALSIVAVGEETGDSATLCTQPGVTLAVEVKGEAEVEVPSFLPTNFKHAICGNGSLLGTLIASAKVTHGRLAAASGEWTTLCLFLSLARRRYRLTG
ncbi:cysteine repeat modular protein, putative [Eimeria mitis]|uniref:Cysteine repeat modular protein, putative n=1 Tax=Eimeria mitis TaxID=44415 RepID=U6K8U0_9EIME|nr:cysteine repeat modular protein, putative [Eimeria mitis]CDJ32637.1 cysteine repeat modular protein, putative [Eimeria mitis]